MKPKFNRTQHHKPITIKSQTRERRKNLTITTIGTPISVKLYYLHNLRSLKKDEKERSRIRRVIQLSFFSRSVSFFSFSFFNGTLNLAQMWWWRKLAVAFKNLVKFKFETLAGLVIYTMCVGWLNIICPSNSVV